MAMSEEQYKEDCETYKIDTPFEVKVEWYTGDVTRETVIGDTGVFYIFEFKRNRSWYAPYTFCTKI